jgi:hypothetical protein
VPSATRPEVRAGISEQPYRPAAPAAVPAPGQTLGDEHSLANVRPTLRRSCVPVAELAHLPAAFSPLVVASCIRAAPYRQGMSRGIGVEPKCGTPGMQLCPTLRACSSDLETVIGFYSFLLAASATLLAASLTVDFASPMAF